MFINQILTKLKSLVYSKSETDSLLNGKASSSHTHTKSQITDFPTIPSKTSQLTNDSGFLTAHQSLSDYSTKANTVKSLSISGKTITVTPGSGNAYTLTTQDTTYTLPTASSTLGGVKTTSTVSDSSGYTACPIISGVPYYKDTNTTYTLSSLGIGNVKNYDQSKAIKSITRSGTTFTYTCLDGTTGTFTQQDNNTTYSFSDKNVTLAWGTKSTIATVGGTDIHVTMPANPNTNTWTAMKGATSSANGSVGYVNAVPPKDGYNTKYLRADGTWQVPPDHTYTVNNATLTIQKNGSNVATFTANASSNVTANISVPTKVSQLTNDSGFLTSHQSLMYINGNRANNAYRIECGSFNNSNNVSTGRHKLTFPHAFSAVPTVVVVPINPDGAYIVQASNVNKTYFIAEIFDSGGNRSPNGIAIHYIAIGNS